MPWNAETGFMEPPAGGDQAASTQPALVPNTPLPGGGAASTQPAYGVTPPGINPQLPAGFSGTAIGQQPNGGGAQATPFGQGAGQGGGISPLLMLLLQGQGQGQGGLFSNFSPAGMGMNPLMAYFMAQQGGQPGGLGSFGGFGGFGGGAASTQPALVPNAGPPPDPLTAQQRAFMGYGGPGQPPNWAAAMGMPDPTGGWSPQYQPQTPQQASTPQDFVNQWQQMFGSK